MKKISVRNFEIGIDKWRKKFVSRNSLIVRVFATKREETDQFASNYTVQQHKKKYGWKMYFL